MNYQNGDICQLSPKAIFKMKCKVFTNIIYISQTKNRLEYSEKESKHIFGLWDVISPSLNTVKIIQY